MGVGIEEAEVVKEGEEIQDQVKEIVLGQIQGQVKPTQDTKLLVMLTCLHLSPATVTGLTGSQLIFVPSPPRVPGSSTSSPSPTTKPDGPTSSARTLKLK